jgi:hypothetical protein
MRRPRTRQLHEPFLSLEALTCLQVPALKGSEALIPRMYLECRSKRKGSELVMHQRDLPTSLEDGLLYDRWSKKPKLLPITDRPVNLKPATLLNHLKAAIQAMNAPAEPPVNAAVPTVSIFLSAATFESKLERVVQPAEAEPAPESISTP